MMNALNPMTPEELQRLLHHGRGRAILYLMNQDLSQYRDLILDNCLHDYSYDKQVEDTHGHYLYPLIKMSGEEAYYRAEIIRALLEEKDSWDAKQLLDFAVLFARDGDQQAREAIYEKVRRNDTDSTLTGADQVIELDGTDGLIFVLDIIGRTPELSSWTDEFYIRDAEKSLSFSEVHLALKSAALHNPNVAAALANMEGYSIDWSEAEVIRQRNERKVRQVPPPIDISETTTWEEVRDSPYFYIVAFRWANIASDVELTKAARDVDPNEEPRKLRQHLFMFHFRPFPLDPEPLIRLVDHSDDDIVFRALCALELVHHPSVRDLFNQIHTNHRSSARAVGLLRRNYQPGDHQLITRLFENETDPDNLHLMCIHTREVYKDNPTPDALQPLLTCYEKTPCSACRYSCVTAIRDTAMLTDWMIEECLYDAYQDTRELATDLAPKP